MHINSNFKDKIMTDITIYTSPTCGQCKSLMAWMNEKEIPFNVRDISTDFKAKALIISKGFSGVPVIEIAGVLFKEDMGSLRKRILDIYND